jgi:hypothetical protein
VLLYESPASLTQAYERLTRSVSDPFTAANEVKPQTDVGDKGLAARLSLASSTYGTTHVSVLVFTRCRALVHIAMNERPDVNGDTVLAYAKRLDARLAPVVCPPQESAAAGPSATTESASVPTPTPAVAAISAPTPANAPPTSTPPPPAAADTWQTYRNDQAGYSVDYPATWTVDERIDGGTFTTTFTPSGGGAGIAVIVQPGEQVPDNRDIPNTRCQPVTIGGLSGERCFDTIALSTSTTLVGQGMTYTIGAGGKGLDPKVYQRLLDSFKVIR